jgi:hypothetical protein
MTLFDPTVVQTIAAVHAPAQRRRCWTCQHEIYEPGYPALAPDPAEGECQGCRVDGDTSEDGAHCLKWQPALAIPTVGE